MTGRRRACLLDVYETVLTVDGGSPARVLADLAGVDAQALARSVTPWHPWINDGRASVRAALADAVRRCGGVVDDALLDRMVAEDRRLLRERATVFGDVVPVLERLREQDVATALVSNCADNTRPMLAALGLVERVDELVLSCEVGAAKPDALIYETALLRLDVRAAEAVFVDDQRRYCDGAEALGVRSVRIDRTHGDGDVVDLHGVVDLF